MNFDKPFEIDFRPSVPAKVRFELNKLLRGTTRVIVSQETAEGKTAKVNAVRLNTKPNAFPPEPLDEIAEAVTAIMQVAWETQETEDPDIGLPPMAFVVICEQPKTRGQPRPRTQFKYTYKGEHEPDTFEDMMSVEDRAVHRALELQERIIASDRAHISDLQERLLRIVEQVTASGSAGAETMREAIPMFLAGMQAILNAKAMEYSAHEAGAQAQATTDRIKAAIDTLGPFVGIALQQLAAKYGFQMQPPEAADDSDVADVEQVPEHPLAALAEHFGEGLTNRQRAELNRVLTKKQSACFDAMFCATTDAEAYEAYQQVAKHAADKLGVLQSLLDAEQGQVLALFMQGASHYASQKPPQA